MIVQANQQPSISYQRLTDFRPIEPKLFYILQAKERGLTTYIKIRRPTKDIEKRPWHTYHYALEV